MRHRAWLAAIAVVIAILVFVVFRRSSSTHEAPGARDRASALVATRGTPSVHAVAAGTAAKPPEHVTRLPSAAERQAIADRITSARAERARQAPPQQPSLPGPPPEDSHDLERASPKLKVALQEAIPLLAECYKTAPIAQRRSAVMLTLTGDPDVGTLIAADQLRDGDGKPLDPELDGCLRTTFSSLELPPLGNTADLHLQYSFRFDDD